jgi:L-Ala-D/L-Glu epimerase
MSSIIRVTLSHLRLPLKRPYRLSYRTFEQFEPFLVEVEDDAGRKGFADGHVSPGSSSETRAGAWRFLATGSATAIGRSVASMKDEMLARFAESKVAATAFVNAIEVLEGHPALAIRSGVQLPLLTPINALEAKSIASEIEEWLCMGFATFKVKVGTSVEADLARVRTIQAAVAGRATLRLDANRGYSRDDGIRFSAALDPAGIELFEQPCDADDWDANAAVARASRVPLMLDEPICAFADIDRAADIPGIGYLKLKLKRFGSLSRLIRGLELTRARGMEPVLGDGLGSDVHNWLEACAAVGTIRNAGEFNGFLKPKERLLDPELPFEQGGIVLPEGYKPRIDPERQRRLTIATLVFGG